jgi:hypothetical protein
MNAQPTLDLRVTRPAIGATVEIIKHRLTGAIRRVRDANMPGVWFLDILPTTALDDSEMMRNVYSTDVVYLDADGTRRPVSPVGETPSLGRAV